MPPARPDIAAARPSRRMAPRLAGRASLTYSFGEDWQGSRWCLPDKSDFVSYARSRRSSGQRIPDTDMEAREVGGMRHACRDPYRLRYRARGHIALLTEIPSNVISTRSQRGLSYYRDGYGPPARIGITVGASPMAARRVSADSGAARGTGRESDVTGGYMARRCGMSDRHAIRIVMQFEPVPFLCSSDLPIGGAVSYRDRRD